MMKFLQSILLFLSLITAAHAQPAGNLQAGQVWGNPTASTKPSTATTVGALIDRSYSCTAQGDLLFRGASLWTCLVPGTVGKALVSGGAGADISWAVLGLTGGGTGQITAVAARQAAGLNIFGDAGTSHGDTNATIGNTERVSYTSATLTASRTWTLPAANITGAPYLIRIVDLFGGINGANTLIVSRAGSDTINGSTTTTLATAYTGTDCLSDGNTKWICTGIGGSGGGGGVSSVIIAAGSGIGVTGTCTITTSGTCTIALATMAAATLRGNATSSTAAASDLAFGSLTARSTPSQTADLLIIRNNATTTLQSITPADLSRCVLTTVSTNTTLTAAGCRTILVDATSAAVTITLYAASASVNGDIIRIKKIDASTNNVIVVPPSGNIDGFASVSTNTRYGSFVLQPNDSQWWQL